ncbi:MAG: hypothetical protein HOO99_05765 [Hyphomicrobiaceae bacterium]|nr:hypothetical protein [Hyphomicrobiaceae bacterium]
MIVIVPGEVLQVLPNDANEAAFSIIGFYALLFVWMSLVAAITDAPSVSFFVIGIGGILMLGDLIRLAIGPAPPLDDELQSDDND